MATAFAGASVWTFDHGAGEALLARGVEAGGRSGNPPALGGAALAQGRVLGNARRTDEAVAAFETAVARFAQIGNERYVLAARSGMAHALRRGGRLGEAGAVYRHTIRDWVP